MNKGKYRGKNISFFWGGGGGGTVVGENSLKRGPIENGLIQ
jgi:hypothetical protein